MKKKIVNSIPILFLVIVFPGFVKIQKPTLFIIGDSTVKNGKIANNQKQVGWGELLSSYLDSSSINVENDAVPGRSSRTYITEGHWQKVLDKMHKGDYLLLQFGHNDAGNIADSLKPRGSLRGISDDSAHVYNHVLQRDEYVHSYGWYLRKIIDEATAKGVLPIVVSPIPRHIFNNGKVLRADSDYGLWAKQTAQTEHVPFLDLNNRVADIYDSLGFDKTSVLFPQDHTHTNREGATINVRQIIAAIEEQPDLSPLRKYLIEENEKP
ncbi:MAG: rhamnogalacturonan acetylesterase [Chitinophagaceae bacterium]